MDWNEVKRAIDDRLDAFEQYKKVNDQRFEALEKGEPTGELEQKLARIDTDITKFTDVKDTLETEHKSLRDRIEELEAAGRDPGLAYGDRKGLTENERKYEDSFWTWIRSAGMDRDSEAKMLDIQHDMIQRKEINIGTPSAGGYAVPKVIAQEIERLEALFSPVRSLVKVVSTTTSDYHELVDIRGTSATWVGEQGPRPETNTPALRDVNPTHGELYAYPKVSEWALNDMQFDPAAWLAEAVAQEFALETGDAVIRGDGTNKPTGMINTAPTAGADFPITRGQDVYEGITAAGDGVIAYDDIVNLVYAVNPLYLPGAVFAMSTATTAAIRKLATSEGLPLWQPAIAAGEPDTFMGYAISKWEQMDAIPTTTGTGYPIAFGNFRRGYVLNDIAQPRITRDDVTAPGFVNFYTRRRFGGRPLNNNALKFMIVTKT